MPSLHMSHAFVFLYFSFKYVKWLIPFVILSLMWFFMDSMALGWHYLIDIPFGLLLGWAACFVSTRINWDRTFG
jgi:hypothetical protein